MTSLNTFASRSTLDVDGRDYEIYRLDAVPGLERLPYSLKVLAENLLRTEDGANITADHVRALAAWDPAAEPDTEIQFTPARVVMQDFTGVPLLADLAAMRNVAADLGKNPKRIEPLVPVDLVVDHSVMIDHYGDVAALDLNMKLEFSRNRERYQFMKWGMQAFDTFKVVPPGIGIVHQVNLEYLARGVHQKADGDRTIYYPDTLVGTDSHTTMINGIGVVGWGVGGIEAEAGMLGQPVYFLTPDVVGVHLKGKLREGVTATDLVLRVTELLRATKVVGKFVEFFGEGTQSLALPDRATIANMAPEYGATMGFFPVDEKTIEYFRGSGRTDEEIDAFEKYFRAQELFGIPAAGQLDYSQVVELDLDTIVPSLAGPKRPQDRIELTGMKQTFETLFSAPVKENGFNKKPEDLKTEVQAGDVKIHNGDVLIAEEGRREGPDGGAAHQDLAGARIAGGERVPGPDRPAAVSGIAGLCRGGLWLYDLYRQRGRPASRVQRGHRRERSGLCGRAVGQPELRGPDPPEHPRQLPGLAAAGGGLRHCRVGAEGPDEGAGGEEPGR